jgi:hypothetical protein
VQTTDQARANLTFNQRWLDANDLGGAGQQGQTDELAQQVAGLQVLQEQTVQREQAANERFAPARDRLNMLQSSATQGGLAGANINAPAQIAPDVSRLNRGLDLGKSQVKAKLSNRGKQSRGQQEQAFRYAQKLEAQQPAQVQFDSQFIAPNAMPQQAAQVELEARLVDVENNLDINGFKVDEVLDGSGNMDRTATRSGVFHGRTASGDATGIASTGVLGSLDVILPGLDGSRWISYRFTTPRGDIRVTAHGISREWIAGAKRAGLAILAVLILWALQQIVRGLSLTAKRRIATALILLGAVGLLIGILPVAALVLLVVGIVLKLVYRSRRRKEILAAG